MTAEAFPRKTNSLLTQDEKNFLDDLPDQAVDVVFANGSEGTKNIQLSFVSNDLSSTQYYEFAAGERAKAVIDYYEMLFFYGIRKDPRV